MESLLHRYRNITVLFVAIIAQIAAVAYQVRRDDNVPLLRIWAVSAVTPVATIIEDLRFGASGVFADFFHFPWRARPKPKPCLEAPERDHLRLENQLLKNELSAAQRAGSLAGFQAHTPSKMIGARVIGVTTGMNTRSVLIDAGRFSGVRRGMAVVTPDGIAGRVLAVYPLASQVLSVTDAGFAAAVESQKNHTRGVLKGMGSGSSAKVDYVPSGQKVEQGETFFTSGDDRIFPRGMPVGKVISVEDGATFQNIYVEPFGAEAAPEEVFVIVDPIHNEIPDGPPTDSPVFLAPGAQAAANGAPPIPSNGTQADKVVDQYRKIGAAQNHTFGEGLPGSLPPNFNLKVPGVNAPAGATGGSGLAPAKSRWGWHEARAALAWPDLRPAISRGAPAVWVLLKAPVVCVLRDRRPVISLEAPVVWVLQDPPVDIAGPRSASGSSCERRCRGIRAYSPRPKADRNIRRHNRSPAGDPALSRRNSDTHNLVTTTALMEFSTGRILVDDARQIRRARYPIWVFFIIPLASLLIQVYLPLFETLRFVAKIDLPLLVTIYFALMRRSQLRGLTIGLILGLAQDSFSRFYIGMYGMCKTMVGYFSASVGMQFDVEHSFVRILLCFVFYMFHQFLLLGFATSRA